MGFKSIMKKVGKVALKVAPYAAMAIPGVGVPLGMAISGAANAASKKASGGSWKDALISGGIGAGTAAIGGGALGGIGPSSSVVSKLGAGALGKTAGTGVAGKVGGILGGMASNAIGRGGGPLVDETYGGRSVKDMIGNSVDQLGRMGQEAMANRGRPSDALSGYSNQSSNQSTGRAIPRGPSNAPGFSYGPNTPNFADSILAGRREAIRNQPFRGGYDITAPNPDDAKLPREVVGHMPQIYSDLDQRRRRPLASAAY